MDSNKNEKFVPPILSKLIVSPHPISPSSSNLATNQDGQFSILTRADINIFVSSNMTLSSLVSDTKFLIMVIKTPAYGMQVDLRSIFQSPKVNGTDVNNNIISLKGKEKAIRQTIPIFKTCITLSKNDKTDWSWWSDGKASFKFKNHFKVVCCFRLLFLFFF